MAIYNEYFTVKKLNQYTNAWMQAIKTIYELQSDTTATTEDPRYAAYNTAAELASTVEHESDSGTGNRIYPSATSYGGNYNVLVIRWFTRTYDFYEARLNSTPMTGEIATASQNEYDKQEPVITDPSSQIAPNGKHYSVSDIQSVMNTDNVSLSEAIIKLAGTEKYKKTDTITVKAPDAITENNKTTVSGQFSSDLDKKKNEQLAKEHPERVVDGVYYADDDALKKAQEAKEARVKEETQQATAEAKANAEKLATTLSTIQKTLYGDNTEAADQLTGTVGGVDLSSALGNVMSIRQRQKLLNFKDFVSDYKEPSTGKPPNNADPFPVDQKIEEFESHQPRVKIHEVVTHVHGQAATIAAMSVSDNAEKRLVRLENNMATIMRYLFRLGSRMSINCQYWGGTSPFEKYKAIRCLRTDRVSDGQLVSIDQCLTCTRFQSVYGMPYEILNDLGLNVAQVLDDNQDSYMNNEEYVRFSRVEEFQNKPKAAKFPLSSVTRAANNDDQGFAPYWGKGIVMNWQLVPVEEQKVHINWRQSINDDGSSLGHLASWQSQAASLGANITSPMNNEANTNLYLENQKDMDSKKETEGLSDYIQSGISFCQNKIEAAKVAYQNARESIKEAVGGSTDIDELAILAAATVRNSTDYKGIAEEYRSTANALNGAKNPAHIWTAMGTNVEMVKLHLEGKLTAYISAKNEQSSSNKNGSVTIPSVSQDAIEAPTIVETNLTFVGELNDLGQVQAITIHNTGGNGPIESDHEYDKTVNDNKGLGYHFYITKDGTIQRGRPENKLGAHAYHANSGNLGIALVGNFNETEPTEAQIKSLISLLADLCTRYNLSPTRQVIRGHKEWPDNETDCPGNNLITKLDDIVKSVATGTYTGTKDRELWTKFAGQLKQGLTLQGTSNVNELDFFPKICFLYVNLMSAVSVSSFDGPEWGFPFTEEQINGFDQKGVDLTDQPFSGRNHEGVDLVPAVSQAGSDAAYSLDVPFSACKDGMVFIQGQWCNGIYVQHDDGTWSRYLHPKSHLVKHGDRVTKGQPIGIVGGHDGTSNTAYAWHLHLEMGTQVAGKTPYEKVHVDNCLINPVDQWKPTNGTDPVASGYKGWFLK